MDALLAKAKTAFDPAAQTKALQAVHEKFVNDALFLDITHDVNPRAYLHVVTKLIVQGWPKTKLRDLLPDRMLASHPELYVGERPSLPLDPPALVA